MRIEELMALVQETLAQGRPLEELRGPIQAVLESTDETLESFLADTQGDSEMPEETRQGLSQALDECLDGLEAMQESLSQGKEALQQSVQETLEKVHQVRQLQLTHEASLSVGPTSFAYLNRLLAQAARGDLASLNSLLQDRLPFLQLLREELALRTLGPRESQQIFDLQAVLERQVSDLQAFQSDLLAAASRLAPLLARPAERRPGGWLSVMGLERVAQLLSDYQGRPEDGLQAALTRCRTALQGSVPPSSPAPALAALNGLLSQLDLLQEDLQEVPEEVTEIRGYAPELLALGRQLESALAVAPGAPNYNSQSAGLPVIFRSVLEPAYAFQEAAGDANVVLAAAEHLQALLDSLEENHPEPSDALDEALQVLSEAVEALQAVAGSGGPLQVELANDLCREAAEKLQAAGIRLK
ncbi:MAG: hypothetical protein U0931_28960 [Vulcanimicrobiota bacterium]